MTPRATIVIFCTLVSRRKIVPATLWRNIVRKIVEQFFPSRGFGKLKLGEARKAMNVVSAK